MWLIAGLGNPGPSYKHNRHNIGFMVMDALLDGAKTKSKFHADMAEMRIADQKAIILKPQTFMNNSGTSVAEAAQFYKIDPDHIIIFHDELDLDAGKVRVKKGGGAAGHNGLRSIDAHLGSKEYWRVRMGIGHPGDKDKVHAYVLNDFPKVEREIWVENCVNDAAKHIDLLLSGEMSLFMTRMAE